MGTVGSANRKAVMFGEAEVRQLRGKNKLESETLDKVETQLSEAIAKVRRLQDKRTQLNDGMERRKDAVEVLEKNIKVLLDGEDLRDVQENGVVELAETAARLEINNQLARSTSGINSVNYGF